MFSNHYLTIFEYIEYSVLFPFIVIFLVLSVIWNCYFAERIWHFTRLYRVYVEKAKYEPYGNYSAIATHCRTERIKYTFLLLINICEFGSMPIYAMGSAFNDESQSGNEIYFPYRVTVPNCTTELDHSRILDLRFIYGNPLNAILTSTGLVGLMLSLVFGICLMKYLHEYYHNITTNSFAFIKRFLKVSVLVSVSLIITGSIPQLMIIHKLFEPMIQLTFLCVWIKHARIFYKTLQWRSLELRARGNSASLVRRSVLSCYQFSIVMSCMGIGYASIILSEIIAQYFSLFAIALSYGPCLFNYLYGTAYYEPLLATQEQTQALLASYDFGSTVTTLLVFTTVLFGGLQYILGTLLFFGRILTQKLNYRFGRVRTRFTPSLTQNLLSS